jgi:hypothetical protein
MCRCEPGFLIVRDFNSLYVRFPEPADRPIYAIPVRGMAPESMAKRYRGIDREPLEPWSLEDLRHGLPGIPFPRPEEQAACVGLFDLGSRDEADWDFIWQLEDARHIYALLENRHEWEVVWVAPVAVASARPPGSVRFGFEPTWYTGDHFSAVCDCLCFPRWHGTDPEGILFREHYERLNAHALLDSVEEAEAFLAFYRSHDWAETGDYLVAEVRGLPDVWRE